MATRRIPGLHRDTVGFEVRNDVSDIETDQESRSAGQEPHLE
jgi:hypothetical protein